MAEPDENELLAIEVDPDDYASTAAGDTPSSVSRTYQSEADFQVQKASYTAKIDGGKSYTDLILSIPALATHTNPNQSNSNGSVMNNGHEKITLTKKQVQLLGYAVGELYFDARYADLCQLCERVRSECVVDEKLVQSLERWERRSRERMSDG